ncbi:chorismate synthase, partial [Psychrobacter proteolyticus]|uniref:chorismate synthase n=1 Tax=Psychrobacter proteolyticus TaxID=147825 RepID=UPI00311DD998
VIDPSQIDCQFLKSNPFFCADKEAIGRFETMIDNLRREGTSCGARHDIIASAVPVGLREPVFDRLEADIA